jgi:hypothetical protein
MVRDPLAIIAINAPDSDRWAHDIFGHVAGYTLILRRDLPLLDVGHEAVGILPETPIHQPVDGGGLERLAEHRQEMPLPLAAQQRVGHVLHMLPARSLAIIAPAGGDQMEMGMVTTTVTIP